MAESDQLGKIAWIDQTSKFADYVRDFYEKVVGWRSQGVSMGEYEDYNMVLPDSDVPVAGVCHARGSNADLPTGWLIYILVADVERSAEECVKMGGEIMIAPREMGEGRVCIIKDPAGTITALYQK